MIEREFIKTKMKNLRIKKTIESKISKGAGIGEIDIEKTPLGEKIIIHTLRPGLIIGRGGETIKFLTQALKIKYKLENPQIEVREVPVPELDAAIVARQIASEFERFGIRRFKATGYRTLSRIMKAGAMGAEIIISGKVPGKRSKVWRFYKGYLKKSGDVADSLVDSSMQIANTNPGVVGIKVNIMHEDIPLPDRIKVEEAKSEELKGEEKEAVKKEIKEIEEAEKEVENSEKKLGKEEKEAEATEEKPSDATPGVTKGKQKGFPDRTGASAQNNLSSKAGMTDATPGVTKGKQKGK